MAGIVRGKDPFDICQIVTEMDAAITGHIGGVSNVCNPRSLQDATGFHQLDVDHVNGVTANRLDCVVRRVNGFIGRNGNGRIVAYSLQTFPIPVRDRLLAKLNVVSVYASQCADGLIW